MRADRRTNRQTDILITILRILSVGGVTRNLSIHIDLHLHAVSTLHDPVTLTFELLTSESVHAEILPESIRVPCLALVTQAVFLLERGHIHRPTDRQVADATDHPTHASAVADVNN